jgi:ABC-type transport system involved in cytochrome c biogenesis ATPase subunit
VSAIAVERLSKRYGEVTALQELSFEVPAGQVVTLLGPNGAGKTTTVEILEGYQAASGGSARVLGADPRHAGRAWRARVGLVLQSSSLDGQLTVREALGVYATLYPRPRPVGEVLELIDLERQADSRIGQLSGGQRRRVDLGLGGRLLADARPAELRARGAPTTIRFPLPPGAPVADLPVALAGAIDLARGELRLHTGEVTAALDALTAWAWRNGVELAGIEVGPPSLEDAYLALVGETPAAQSEWHEKHEKHKEEVSSHGRTG